MAVSTWPYRLLTPSDPSFSLEGGVVDGTPALNSFNQSASFGGGGYWRADYFGISLRTPEQILAARAWAAHLRGGVKTAIIPCWDIGLAPRGLQEGRPAKPGLPKRADEYDAFGWEADFGARLIVADLNIAAGLRATSVQIELQQGTPIRGGQRFSLNHSIWGWRLYEIERVTSRNGQLFTCDIWPPLRQAAPQDTAVEFDVPRVVMTLDPSSNDGFRPRMRGSRAAPAISLRFREGGKPV